LDDHAVYLVPIGRGRFELYAEPTEEPVETDGVPGQRAGFWRRLARRFHESWRETSRAAYAARGVDSGRLAGARDWLVRRIADSIADQQTLWSLRDRTAASFVYPADVSEASATAFRDRLLVQARRRHGIWLLVNLVVAVTTVALVLLPGPNLIGYYFAFRVIGHFFSWRGARRALNAFSWHSRAEPLLADLGRLADQPPAERAVPVSRIGEQLGLPHFHRFFERASGAAR
jgi:hypothetical protein